MKILLNLIILGVIGLLGYLLYSSINEPIKFRGEMTKRKDVVVNSLQNIRTTQELYRDIKGEYASSFNDLKTVLTNDSIPFRQLLADPEDPENPDKFIENIILTSALDSLKSLNIDLNGLEFVPYTNNGVTFSMNADTMTYQQTLVPVVEVMTRWKDFMGEFADPKFSMYEKNYNPENKLGFGSMNSPNLEGNWR